MDKYGRGLTALIGKVMIVGLFERDFEEIELSFRVVRYRLIPTIPT